MKNASIALFFGMVILFSSCEKDEENRLNQFVHDGDKFEISWGFISLEYDDDDAFYTASIDLYPNTIFYNPEKDHDNDLSGTGFCFAMEDMVSSTSNFNGTYIPLSDDDDDLEVGLLEFCGYQKGIDYSDYSAWSGYIQFKTGELKMNKEGDNYIVQFDGKDARGLDVSLYYKGELIER